MNKTENGYLNVIEMLYSNDSVSHYPGYPTIDTNYYKVLIGALNGRQKFTETIKVAIPSALRTVFSLKAGGISKI